MSYNIENAPAAGGLGSLFQSIAAAFERLIAWIRFELSVLRP